MKRLVFAFAGIAALATAATVGAQQRGNKPEPSEWTMVLSGLGLVALGLSRKPRLQLAIETKGGDNSASGSGSENQA